MRKFDTISGLFLLIFAIGICTEAIHLGIGRPNAPMPGFFPFATGSVLAVLAILIMVQARGLETSCRFWAPNAHKNSIYLAFLLLLGYALLVERLGFVGASFLFFLTFSRFVSRHRWPSVLVFSFLCTFITYALFKYLLRAPFPQGILEGIF